ncbi:MAG: MerR family transcriptional regulator [Actinobacteria bacterium]|nr:MerR family transcriptional regulator [Actinomycetota bacterium]
MASDTSRSGTEVAPEAHTVAAVARRLGVAPATLRTWDRRYGIGPTDHSTGEHRRYTAGDIARLTLMRKLVISGVSPAEAAQRALAFDGESSAEVISTTLAKEVTVREELVETVLRAARAYDRNFVEELLRSEMQMRGITNTWNEVIVPLLILLGDEWADAGTGIETEHLVSEIIKRLLQEWNTNDVDPINPRPVLLACIGEEMHSLPLYALAAALSERKIQAQFLGARTPIEAISAVVKRSAPPAVFLWAQLNKNGDLTALDQIPSIRPAPRVVIGGPGWGAAIAQDASNKGSFQKSAVHVDDLVEACEEILRAVGG